MSSVSTTSIDLPHIYKLLPQVLPHLEIKKVPWHLLHQCLSHKESVMVRTPQCDRAAARVGISSARWCEDEKERERLVFILRIHVYKRTSWTKRGRL